MRNLMTKIRFACPDCNCRLVAEPNEAGDRFQCPRCPKMLTVPGEPAAIPEVLLATEEGPDKLVAVDISLPKVGGLKTKVTQDTADKMAFAWMGGVLVAIGFIVCTMLGVKPPAPPRA